MTFRPVIKAAALIAALFWGWDKAITNHGLMYYIDRHPQTIQADSLLYFLGSYHEIFNRPQQSLEAYSRVVKKFGKSRYAEKAQFGVAASYERLYNKEFAIREYSTYLEKYPEGRYSRSVRQNLNLLTR